MDYSKLSTEQLQVLLREKEQEVIQFNNAQTAVKLLNSRGL